MFFYFLNLHLHLIGIRFVIKLNQQFQLGNEKVKFLGNQKAFSEQFSLKATIHDANLSVFSLALLIPIYRNTL